MIPYVVLYVLALTHWPNRESIAIMWIVYIQHRRSTVTVPRRAPQTLSTICVRMYALPPWCDSCEVISGERIQVLQILYQWYQSM